MSNTYPDKDFANAQAQAALVEAILDQIEDDRGATVYVLTRHHVTRQLRSLVEVTAWLDRLSGKVAPTVAGR